MIIESGGMKIGTSAFDDGSVVIKDDADRMILVDYDQLYLLSQMIDIFSDADPEGKINPKTGACVDE